MGRGTSHVCVLVERTFDVDVPADRSWALLADVARWPEWAPHIKSVSVDPPGPVGSTSRGVFRFRPIGRGAFTMTTWDPPRSWTWTGRALGITIDYDHTFEPIDDGHARLHWVVRTGGAKPGRRARLFTAVYSRLIDKAWPEFAQWAARRGSR